MGIIAAVKKGFEIAGKSLLLCLIAMIILFVGYMIVGAILGGSILASKFPPITPDMTPQQINALNWSQVNWALFIPAALVAFILGFLLNSFTQGGIISTLRDCVKEGRERISAFFGYAAKYCIKMFIQILFILIVTIVVVILGLLVMTLVALINVKPVVIAIDAVIFMALLAALIYTAMVLVYGQINLIFDNSKAIKALGNAVKFVNKNLLKAFLLFLVAGIIYVVIYVGLRQLTFLTLGWPIVSQIIWNLATSYIYILISIFMVGSFITFYSATAKE